MKVQAKQVHDELQSGGRVLLLDVRTPVEHEEMHIAGSRLMPLDKLDPTAVKEAAAGSERCVVICRSGNRSLDAGHALEEAGFTQVYNVLHGFEGELDDKHHRGSMTGWRFDGLPWEQC